MQSINMEDLEKVTGGFKENKGYAKGIRIECPKCGNTLRDGFSSWEDDDVEANVYLCESCGKVFSVNSKGKYNKKYKVED